MELTSNPVSREVCDPRTAVRSCAKNVAFCGSLGKVYDCGSFLGAEMRIWIWGEVCDIWMRGF